MPMRNRRIRLLILALFIAVSFVLYSRSDPATIDQAKQYATRKYQQALDQTQHALDQTLGKQSTGSLPPGVEEKKDEPFRVDFEKYSKAAAAAAGEPTDGVRAPPPAQPAPLLQEKPVAAAPVAQPAPPKKDDPMRVNFLAYSSSAPPPEASEAPGLLKNPNPIAAFGVEGSQAQAAAKPAANAPATPEKDASKPRVPQIGKPDNEISPIGEGRVSIDVDALQTAAPVYWSKPVERYPPASPTFFPLNAGVAIPKIQHEFRRTIGDGSDQGKLAVIKAAAVHTWKGYREQAFGHDETMPISGNYSNPFNGWGATLVDSLDTLWLMGMVKEFEEAVEAVSEIDFTTSVRSDIPIFETTIRYIGGLLGGYEISSRQYAPLLDQAKQLGEILYGAFDTPNRMPMTYYQWKPAYASQGRRARVRTVMSELGSLGVEFTRLGQLAGEPKYYDAIARITNALEEWQMQTRIPGLWPTVLDASGCKKPPSTDEDLGFSQNKGPSPPRNNDPPAVKPPTTDDRVTSYGKTAKEGLLNSGSNILKRAAAAIEALKDQVSSRLEDLANSGPVKGLTNTVQGVAGTVSEKAQDAAGAALEKTKDVAGTVSGKTKDVAGAVLDKTKDVAGTASEKTKDVAGAVAEKAQGAAGSALEKTKDIAGTVSEKTKDVAGTVSEKAHDVAGKASEKAHDVAGKLASPDNKEEARSSSQVPLGNDASCEPQGLASTHKYGSDIFTFGAAADSTYEYLPKMHMMLGGRSTQYQSMYKKAITAAKKHLLYRAMVPDEKRELLFIGNIDSKPKAGTGAVEFIEEFSAVGSHLTCFVGGMFAMAGKIFESPEDVEIGRKLTDGCIWAYNSTASGIMPELFGLHKCASISSCKWDAAAYNKALDPYEDYRLGKAKSKSPRAALSGSAKAEIAEGARNAFALEKRQYGGGEMQYGINTAPDMAPAGAITKVAESPPLGMGNVGFPPSTPPLDEPAIKMPYDAGAAPKLPTDGTIPNAGAANAGAGPAPYPAAPDAYANPALEKPSAKVAPTVPDSKGDMLAKNIEPAIPAGGVAGTAPNLGSTSPEKKLSADVPGTGIAPIAGDSGRLSAGSGFDVKPSVANEDQVPAHKPMHKEPGPMDIPEAAPLSHADFVADKIKSEGLPPGMVGMYDKTYLLRPEAIESVFYMYRITGEQYWRDRGWEMWQAISKHTEAKYGHAAIVDISKSTTENDDSQESFWMAETLKYFYLLFDNPDRYSLDDWVLNTEAHFFSRFGT